MRRLTPTAWLTAAAFVGALLSRSVWLSEARFHPDASTVLWMALDAVRTIELPDHGLVSTYEVFQPPGLVWATMPFVALGGGRPEIVIVGFALLNAAAIAFLVATAARHWSLVQAGVLATFLVVGPDAFFSAWIWHPSLYTAAVAVLLAAGIRLRHGSPWWALGLVAVPGLYALVHYSGLVLFGPALALLVLSRRAWRALLRPVAVGATLVALAWLPFLSFEVDRDWVDITTIPDAADASGSITAEVHERLTTVDFALSHLGRSLEDIVLLTWVILVLALAAVAMALVRGRWREPGFAVPAAMLASGLAAQVVVDQAARVDVLMLWLVPLYALAAWTVAQAAELVRPRTVLVAAAVALVAVLGTIDLADAVADTPEEETLSEKWRAARSGEPIPYEAGLEGSVSSNSLYLPCDPPYDWGSEIWYLREVLEPGSGIRAAEEAGAFRQREQSAEPSDC